MDIVKFNAIVNRISGLSDEALANLKTVAGSPGYEFLSTPELNAAIELFPVLKDLTTIIKG